MRVHFSDGISIEKGGNLRVLHLSGYYVVGKGNLIPVADYEEAIQTITNMKVVSARGHSAVKL